MLAWTRGERLGGAGSVGETQKQPFQPSFTVSSQVDIPEGRLVLVRIPDERLGIPCIRGSSFLRPGPRFCRGVMPVTSFSS